MENSDKVRKGLKCCVTTVRGANVVKDCDIDCPYFHYGVFCRNALHTETLQIIRQLESRLAQAERERDAALKEWKRTKMDSEGMCWTCKHGKITDIGSCRCVSPFPCDEGEEWQWRGVCEENTKQDEMDRGEEG